MQPKISIIIIVKNDRGIADTLASLATQKISAPSETIVVDASDPALLVDIKNKYPDVRWYQFEPAAANKTSIPEQRNFGIRHAQGEIIVFIDANCVPKQDWLVELTKPILEDKETMTAGPVIPSDVKHQVSRNPTVGKDNYIGWAPTINLAFKKNLWEALGGFDESFLYGSDADFTWRWSDAGHKIYFVHNAVITHDWGNAKRDLGRSFDYGKARAKLFVKHPKRLTTLLNDNLYVTVYTIYILGLPLTFYFWWYPFFILLALLKNINDKPLKTVLYNLSYTVGMWVGFVILLFKGNYS